MDMGNTPAIETWIWSAVVDVLAPRTFVARTTLTWISAEMFNETCLNALHWGTVIIRPIHTYYHERVILLRFAMFLSKVTTTKLSQKQPTQTGSLKSTNVSVCFRGISRVPSAFVFLRWFKLAHISIQVCTFHDGCKHGIDQQKFADRFLAYTHRGKYILAFR